MESWEEKTNSATQICFQFLDFSLIFSEIVKQTKGDVYRLDACMTLISIFH